MDHFDLFETVILPDQKLQTEENPVSCGDIAGFVILECVTNKLEVYRGRQSAKAQISAFIEEKCSWTQTNFDQIRQLIASMCFAVDPRCFESMENDSTARLSRHLDCSLGEVINLVDPDSPKKLFPLCKEHH